MRKLLVVYNICGISGRENTLYYIECLNTLLNQQFDDFQVVVSSCCSSMSTLFALNHLGIPINNITDQVPVNVSFNHTVLESIKRLGEFKGYMYIDSGVTFGPQTNVLEEAYSLLNGENSMVTVRTDTDTGFPVWLGVGSHDNDSQAFNEFFRNQDHYVLPVGKAVNLHCQIFSHDLIEAYKRPVPDIFAGQSSESVFSFLNAAIKKQWVIHNQLEVHHRTGLDIPSVGFSPPQWAAAGNKTWDHLFHVDRSIVDIINDGVEFGMGYEEIRPIVLHNPEKFDSNHHSLDDRLAPYIRDNMFLTTEQFDYNNVNSTWSQ